MANQSFEMEWWRKESLVPFIPCSSFIVSGATKSGKTQWVKKLLENADGMFQHSAPNKILYCYGVNQPAFDDMKKTVKNVTFYEGLPDLATLENHATPHTVVVLDDLMNQVVKNEEMERLFTQGCHHRGMSVIFITQNLFAQGKCSRTISLNATYLILFRNLRDTNQIAYLGRQIGRGPGFLEAYEDSLKDDYGYLVVDMSPGTLKDLRLRTNVFPGESTIVYP